MLKFMLWLPRSRKSKVTRTLVTLAALSILLAIYITDASAQQAVEAISRTEQHRFQKAAWAHFQKRCTEDAHETINRVVENVEAVFLFKPRQRATEKQLIDQSWMGDPYGYSSYEALNPAGAYLYGRSGRTVSGRQYAAIQGYRYVEMPNPSYSQDSTRGRFARFQLREVVVPNSVTKQPEKRIEPRAKEVDELLSRYGVTWEDISTPEDRKYWVAGGKLTILDLRSKEIIAERVGYAIDPELGSTRQGRRVWLAIGFVPDAFCRKFEMQAHRNTEFVAKVLKAPRGKADAR